MLVKVWWAFLFFYKIGNLMVKVYLNIIIIDELYLGIEIKLKSNNNQSA
jgi:hypothetical protein